MTFLKLKNIIYEKYITFKERGNKVSKIVKIKNLSKIYKTGEREFKALDNINLEIEEGNFVVILGPSGAGKSTLLNLIGGMDTPTNGTIKINGEDISNEQNIIAWIPATVGFLFGMVFLLVLDSVIPHLHLDSEKPEGIKAQLKKTTMLVLAVTLHNIPEGMAVGVTFAGALIGNTGITMAGAFALAVGIAIQNFPEGAIISMPLKSEGMSKPKAFLLGTLSGIVEPIGALVTILLTNAVVPVLPYLLSFAAGAMMYVVVEKLIPESQSGEHTNIGTVGVVIGFVIMMILDVALG